MTKERLKELVRRAATLTYRNCVDLNADCRKSELHNARQVLKRRRKKGIPYMPKPQPKLLLIGSSLDFFGVWEVTVEINKKEYTYALSSEYAFNKFKGYYDRGHMGRALACLNHFRIKPYLDKGGIER